MPEIQIAIDPRGDAVLSTVDLLGDYWADFLLFRRDAQVSHNNHDKLRTQRYLRAGLFTLSNYLRGLANRWQASENTDDLVALTLPARFENLARSRQGPLPPIEALDYLTSLASRCADVKPTEESDLSDALTIDQIEEAERRILVWLDEFTSALSLPRHIDLGDDVRSYAAALATMTSWTYKGEDLMADDPHPYQDPPGTWDDPELTPEQGPG